MAAALIPLVDLDGCPDLAFSFLGVVVGAESVTRGLWRGYPERDRKAARWCRGGVHAPCGREGCTLREPRDGVS